MASVFRVSTSFLNNLKTSFPPADPSSSSFFRNPWYIVAAVAFSASNKPELVPRVFAHALDDLKSLSPAAKPEDEMLLARKMREALFKSGLISGYPKAINSLRALSEIMPEDLREKELLRDPNASLAEYGRTGQTLFDSFYGDKSDSVKQLLISIYPDMEWFSTTIGYGVVYGNTSILSALETSYTLVAALIAGDTPQQIAWHLDSAQRGGATLDEVRAVRYISLEVAKLAGVQWQHDIPEVQAD
ncbi:hypothetical protein D9619_006063 [Psilocybe cf. subviscida]|uniref:Carboxymuconolactone decarboxylase-like domain-containing protein n=1 Tax=Psilocybe cf. subviscida TaxID=2480587 RepID=A0A8H5FBG1_9AGAR|nr:hypothetical protein D9619_006063 [Psilocybe cf. subviscida]